MGVYAESLYLSCTGYKELVVFGKFVHTKDGDDILKFFVSLKDFLYTSGYLIMLKTYDSWIEDSRC